MTAMDANMLRAAGLDPDKVAAIEQAIHEAVVTAGGLEDAELLFLVMSLLLGVLVGTPKTRHATLRDALFLAIRLERLAPIVRVIAETDRTPEAGG